MKYAQMNNIPMDYTETLKSMMDVNPQGALNFAKKLCFIYQSIDLDE